MDRDAGVIENNWGKYVKLMDINVRPFMHHQENKLYRPNSYTFYGNQIDSDGYLDWMRTKFTIVPYAFSQDDAHLLPTNRQKREEGQLAKEVKLQSSKTDSDGTMPVESFSATYANRSIRSILATNVDHQDTYKVDDIASIKKRPAIQFTLRAIIKMVMVVPSND